MPDFTPTELLRFDSNRRNLLMRQIAEGDLQSANETLLAIEQLLDVEPLDYEFFEQLLRQEDHNHRNVLMISLQSNREGHDTSGLAIRLIQLIHKLDRYQLTFGVLSTADRDTMSPLMVAIRNCLAAVNPLLNLIVSLSLDPAENLHAETLLHWSDNTGYDALMYAITYRPSTMLNIIDTINALNNPEGLRTTLLHQNTFKQTPLLLAVSLVANDRPWVPPLTGEALERMQQVVILLFNLIASFNSTEMTQSIFTQLDDRKQSVLKYFQSPLDEHGPLLVPMLLCMSSSNDFVPFRNHVTKWVFLDALKRATWDINGLQFEKIASFKKPVLLDVVLEGGINTLWHRIHVVKKQNNGWEFDAAGLGQILNPIILSLDSMQDPELIKMIIQAIRVATLNQPSEYKFANFFGNHLLTPTLDVLANLKNPTLVEQFIIDPEALFDTYYQTDQDSRLSELSLAITALKMPHITECIVHKADKLVYKDMGSALSNLILTCLGTLSDYSQAKFVKKWDAPYFAWSSRWEFLRFQIKHMNDEQQVIFIDLLLKFAPGQLNLGYTNYSNLTHKLLDDYFKAKTNENQPRCEKIETQLKQLSQHTAVNAFESFLALALIAESKGEAVEKERLLMQFKTAGLRKKTFGLFRNPNQRIYEAFYTIQPMSIDERGINRFITAYQDKLIAITASLKIMSGVEIPRASGAVDAAIEAFESNKEGDEQTFFEL